MSLLIPLNTVLIVAFALAGIAVERICHALLKANARHQVLGTAALMLDSALASREDTGEQIDPLPVGRMQTKFLPHYPRLCSALRRWLFDPQLVAACAVAPAPASPCASPSRAGAGGSRHLVRISSSDLRGIEGRLAAELDSKEDRRRFLEACQW